MDKPTISVDDLIRALQQRSKDVDGDLPIYIGVPFRNGIGLHYEGIRNISGHGGIVDMFTTTPDADDVK